MQGESLDLNCVSVGSLSCVSEINYRSNCSDIIMNKFNENEKEKIEAKNIDTRKCYFCDFFIL